MAAEKPDAAQTLADNVFRGTEPRPTLGDWVSIRVLQNRAILYMLSPGTKDLLYYAGRKMGEAAANHLKDVKDLQAALEVTKRLNEQNKAGRLEIVESNNAHAVVRIHECATSYGLPNLGLMVCSFDAGTQAGSFSKLLGKRVVSTEVKCNTNGDPYCEFEIRVLVTPEAVFAEAFR